jgi:hypothetical protein
MDMRSTPTLAALAAVCLLAVLPTAADAQRADRDWLEDCRDHDYGRDEVYCELRDVDVESTGRLHIDGGRNGGAQVVGEARSSVAATARIQTWGDTREDARARAEQIRIVASGGELRADGPAGGSWSVSFAVRVPSTYDLVMDAHNGPLTVRGVSGAIEMSTRNGPVRLEDAGGDVRARTQNGPVQVVLTGARWSGAGLDAETRNGPIHLEIPDGFGAELETGTRHGPFRTEIPLLVTLEGDMGPSRAREIRTRLGDGGPVVRVVTTNGPVVIERR